MSMFALRVPDKLRKDMDRVHINWSEYLRHTIVEAIESEQKRSIISKLRRLTQRSKPAQPGTAVSIIRQMRDHG